MDWKFTQRDFEKFHPPKYVSKITKRRINYKQMQYGKHKIKFLVFMKCNILSYLYTLRKTF